MVAFLVTLEAEDLPVEGLEASLVAVDHPEAEEVPEVFNQNKKSEKDFFVSINQ